MKLINNYIFEKFKINKDFKDTVKPDNFLAKFHPSSKCLCIATETGDEANKNNYLEVIKILSIKQEDISGITWNKATIKILTNTRGNKNLEIEGKSVHYNNEFLSFIHRNTVYHIICEYDSLEEFYKLETNRKFYYDEYQPSADHMLFKLELMKNSDYDIIEEELTK